MSTTIGMMEGAYFVGRAELLDWINTLLCLNYTKIEQCASAAAHCQIFHVMAPDVVPLHKVNFAAKHEHEFVNNFKVLQTVFKTLAIDKRLDVPKLVKAKYQDNLEFCQWVKCYYDRNSPVAEYDAIAERTEAIKVYNSTRPPGARQPLPTIGKGAPIQNQGSGKATISRSSGAYQPVRASVTSTQTASRNKENSATKANEQKRVHPVQKILKSETAAVSHTEYHTLLKQVKELEETLDAIEKERDFYFGKLRDVEILCQTSTDQDEEFIKSIQDILYATEDGAELPQDDLEESTSKTTTGLEIAKTTADKKHDIDLSPQSIMDEELEGVSDDFLKDIADPNDINFEVKV